MSFPGKKFEAFARASNACYKKIESAISILVHTAEKIVGVQLKYTLVVIRHLSLKNRIVILDLGVKNFVF